MAKKRLQVQPGGSLLLIKNVMDTKLMIFDLLTPIESTCLGLTCKELYGIHKERHGKVSLVGNNQWHKIEGMEKFEVHLYFYLRTWMWEGPKLVWGGRFGEGFITTNRMRILQDREKAIVDHEMQCVAQAYEVERSYEYKKQKILAQQRVEQSALFRITRNTKEVEKLRIMWDLSKKHRLQYMREVLAETSNAELASKESKRAMKAIRDLEKRACRQREQCFNMKALAKFENL